MITVRRLNGEEMVINAELIEHIESTPDTVITLVTGRKFVVREDADEVVERVVAYRRAAYGERAAGPVVLPPPAEAEDHQRGGPGGHQ